MNENFVWGVATAAYQIEGAEREGGRGKSIWDSDCTRGKILGGMNGSVACDHYHHFREDVALLHELGIKNYRFSVSWCRLMPEGEGEIIPEGARFYTDLVDELLRYGITPWVTIYHWDLPRPLFEKGGFLNPGISDVFAAYAEAVVRLFGEKVSYYIIFNEPQVVVEDGHFTGAHAPFLRLSRADVFRVAHNVLLCIGKAEKVMRKAARHRLHLGITPCFTPMIPKGDCDPQVAETYQFTPNGEFYDGCFFTDPLILGRFPDTYRRWFAEYGYDPSPEDMAVIKSRFDFFGVNYYEGIYVENTPEGVKKLPLTPEDRVTAMGWKVTPEGMEYLIRYYYDRYGLPILFGENGVALAEWKTLDGNVPDDMRIDFIRRHLEVIGRVSQKYPVIGYFYWSFLDNFEWALGYSKRFGLVFVDYVTQERIPKKSACWYRKVIASNGADLSAE